MKNIKTLIKTILVSILAFTTIFTGISFTASNDTQSVHAGTTYTVTKDASGNWSQSSIDLAIGDTVTIVNKYSKTPVSLFVGTNSNVMDDQAYLTNNGQFTYTVLYKNTKATFKINYADIKYPDYYYITYNLNGGSGETPTDTNLYYVDDVVTLNSGSNISNSGYTFSGWSPSSSATEGYTGTYTVQNSDGSEHSLTLYAVWSANNYNITYNLDNGTNNVNNPLSYTEETETITLADPTKNGYTFDGWFSESTFDTQVTTIEKGSTGDVTLYAKWTLKPYNITYNLNNGINNGNNPSSYTIETETITLADPTRNGYIFGGWFSENTFEIQVTTIEKGSTGNVTLYAKWVNYVYTYSEITKSWDKPVEKSYKQGDIITFKDIYTGFSMFNYVLYVNGTDTATVSGGASRDYTVVNNGAIIELCPSPDVKVNVFDVTPYTITYNLDDGTNNSNNPAYYNQYTETFTLASPIKDGYVFNGWFSESTFDTQVTTIEKGSTGDKTLYAKWTKVITSEPSKDNDYKVSVDSSLTDVTYQWYKYVSTSIDVKDSTEIELWTGTYNQNDNTYSSSLAFGVSNVISFHPKTGVDVDMTKIWLQYTLNGEVYLIQGSNNYSKSNPGVGTYNTNEAFTISNVKVVKYTGVTINGETSDTLGLTTFGNTSYYCEVSKNDEVIAHSNVIASKAISFDGGDDVTGTAPDTHYSLEGKSITMPSNTFTKVGYKFLGWNTDSSAETALSFTNNKYTVGDSDVTFYAIWKEKTAISITETYQTATYNSLSQSFLLLGTDKDAGSFVIKYYLNNEWTTTTPINAGTYSVQITRDEDDTYKRYFLDTSLTIDRLYVTLNWGSADLEYTGEKIAPNVTVSNLCGTDTCNVTLTDSSKIYTGSTTAVVQSIDNSNYEIPMDSNVYMFEFRVIHTHGTKGQSDYMVFDKADFPSEQYLAGGNYYLTHDTILKGLRSINGGVTINICLNGYSLQLDSQFIIAGVLNIIDCKETERKYDINNEGRYVLSANGTNTINGGVVYVYRSSDDAFFLQQNGVLNFNNVNFVGSDFYQGSLIKLNEKSTLSFNDCLFVGNIFSENSSNKYLIANDSTESTISFTNTNIQYNYFKDGLFHQINKTYININDNVIIRNNKNEYYSNYSVGLAITEGTTLNVKENVSGTNIDVAIYKTNPLLMYKPDYKITTGNTTDISNIFTLVSYDGNDYYSTEAKHFAIRTKTIDDVKYVYISKKYKINYSLTPAETNLNSKVFYSDGITRVDNNYYFYDDTITTLDFSKIVVKQGDTIIDYACYGWSVFKYASTFSVTSDYQNYILTKDEQYTIESLINSFDEDREAFINEEYELVLQPCLLSKTLYYSDVDGKFHMGGMSSLFIVEFDNYEAFYNSQTELYDRIKITNFEYSTVGVIGLSFENITIELVGTSTIQTKDVPGFILSAHAIHTDSLTIVGDGTLNLIGNAYITGKLSMNSGNLIIDNAINVKTKDRIVLYTANIEVKDDALIKISTNDTEVANAFYYSNAIFKGKSTALQEELYLLENLYEKEDGEFIIYCTKIQYNNTEDFIYYDYVEISSYKFNNPNVSNNFIASANYESTYQWFNKGESYVKAVASDFLAVDEEIIENENLISLKNDEPYIFLMLTGKHSKMRYKTTSIVLNLYEEYGIYNVLISSEEGVNTYTTTIVEMDGYYQTEIDVDSEDFDEEFVIYDVEFLNDIVLIEGATNATYQPTNSGDYFVKGMANYAYATSDLLTATTITFDTNGGTGTVDSISNFVGTQITLPTPSLTKTGMFFNGWSTNKDGTALPKQYTFTDSDVTLYAIWGDKEVIDINEDAQEYTYNSYSKSFILDGTDKAAGSFVIEYYVENEWTSTSPINAGSYNVKITREEDSTYKAYSKEIENGLVINRYEVEVTFCEDDFTYDGTDQKAKLTATYKNVDGNDVALAYEHMQFPFIRFGVNEFINAGSYEVYFRFATDLENSNYMFAGNISCMKVYTMKKLVVEEPTISSIEFAYDGTEKTVTVYGVESYMTAEKINVYSATNIGSYQIKYILDDNHEWADDGIITWTITKGQAVITVDETEIVKTFGEKVTLPTATSNYGTVVCNKTSSDLVNADTYIIKYTVEGTDTYYGAVKQVIVIINKLKVNEPVVTKQYVYNGEFQTAEFSGVESYMTKVDPADENMAYQKNPGVYVVLFTLDHNHEWADGSDGNVYWEIKQTSIAPKSEDETETRSDVIVETVEGFDSTISVTVEITIETEVETKELAVDYYDLVDENVKLENNEVVGVVYEVKLIQTINGVSKEIQPSDIKEGTTIKVKMLIPEDVDINKVTRILHVHSKDDIEVIPFDKTLVDEDGYYTIEIDRLSEFAFVYKKSSAGWIILIVFGSLIAIFVGLFFVWKKEYEDAKNEEKLEERKLKVLDPVYRPINHLVFERN